MLDLAAKRVELLHDTLPNAKRVAVMWNPANPGVAAEWRIVQQTAGKLDLTVDSLTVSNVEDLTGALDTTARRRPDALLLIIDQRLESYRKLILEHAAKHRIPLVAGRDELARDGALLSYAPNYTAMFARAAVYVDKILKGASPADLPVEQPTQYELVINLKTAKSLGLTIPQSLLRRADEVIQ